MDDGSIVILDGEFISKEEGEFFDWLNSHDFSVKTKEKSPESEVDELGSKEVNLDEISRLIKIRDDKLQNIERRKKNSNVINIKPLASVEASG